MHICAARDLRRVRGRLMAHVVLHSVLNFSINIMTLKKSYLQMSQRNTSKKPLGIPDISSSVPQTKETPTIDLGSLRTLIG